MRLLYRVSPIFGPTTNATVSVVQGSVSPSENTVDENIASAPPWSNYCKKLRVKYSRCHEEYRPERGEFFFLFLFFQAPTLNNCLFLSSFRHVAEGRCSVAAAYTTPSTGMASTSGRLHVFTQASYVHHQDGPRQYLTPPAPPFETDPMERLDDCKLACRNSKAWSWMKILRFLSILAWIY